MSDELKFRVSSELKNIIGRDLITDDYIAVFELVKNSFDSHATEVEIIFENIYTSEGKIIIIDNGKGMNYDDLINKWLFVAYSAKKDGTEDIDYRDKINNRFYYAGAKGIGRFSCDKLGTSLRLVSKKDEPNSRIEEIIVDWTKFEENSRAEFVNIPVDHQILEDNPSKFQTGTFLEITGLRVDSNWDSNKIIKLKHSLSKLINPFEDNNNRKFKINVTARDFVEYDNDKLSSYWKVNGPVENNLLSILKNKTVHLLSRISTDGHTITTELSDNGRTLYKIVEKNNEYHLLQDILVELYHLDRKARTNFTRLMGIKAVDYGSLFLYKNNIRIYPYGEPGEDSFSLDIRQQKKIGNHVGTTELIGRIEISGENEEFKETTSRGDGLIKNRSYYQLQDFFINNVISKLENYVMKFLKYGIDIKKYDSSRNNLEGIVKYISGFNNKDILSIEFHPDLLGIIGNNQIQSNSAITVLSSIENIAREFDNLELLEKVNTIKSTLEDAIATAEIAEEEIKQKDKLISEKNSENLFLKSVKSQDLDEIVSFMHSVGISSDIVNNYVNGLYKRVNRGEKISNEELAKKLREISLENRKILAVSQFATKANFKLFSEEIETDIIEFIHEYTLNILTQIRSEDIKINSINSEKLKFICKFRPIEITIIIDNLVSNSIRAKAKYFDINYEINNNELMIKFKDDGKGIPDSSLKNIFDIGFTTTSGSGLGLFHVNSIISKTENLSIEVDNQNEKGVIFILKFNKHGRKVQKSN
ncbi:sensor histidine kinase [Flavobacterium sp. AED]|uniref:sensor histidine kinase n=1 Tax=Flavobacterium sp. AED TaxID=1423323 RepID=UPI000691C44E|nr:sensor histidine kinase [Flavobacterium sp. AED]